MSANTGGEQFRLGRLRFIRLPPTSISFTSKAESQPFDLGFGITDDYGTDIDLFESIDLRLEVVSETRDGSIDGLRLKTATDERSDFSQLERYLDFSFTPSRGPFHSLSIKLVTTSAKGLPTKSVRFRLRVAPRRQRNDSQLSLESVASRKIRELVDERDQQVLETWNDARYVFLSVDSGEVELTRTTVTKTPSEKVQTTIRRIRPSDSADAPISIVERPALNNSTGQRLWDCAMGISAYFSLYPDALLDPSLPSFEAELLENGSPRSNKRRKTSNKTRPTRIVELGAGCALASLVAGRSAETLDGEVSVVATDIAATVDTTLAENLEYNARLSRVDKRVLDWGTLTDRQVHDVLLGSTSTKTTLPTRVTLVATDVLYNPESHSLLLDTLLSFLRPSETVSRYLEDNDCRALIAYKRRTDGDDGFFDLAKEAGLEVAKIWEWSEVSVWSFH